MAEPAFQRIKLIYNPLSGRSDSSANLLQEVISKLQENNFIPEVCLVEVGINLFAILDDALDRGIHLYVVCGGDGTIESVSQWIIGKPATLAIIPAGTQNNVALSLGIPNEVKAAVGLLRSGHRSKIDVGIAKCDNKKIPFLEACSIGLLSALFNSADNLQKGNLASLSDIFSTLVNFPSAQIRMTLEDSREINLQGHATLVANLPYFGLNYRLTPSELLDDGILDVLVFTEFTKLGLVGNILQNAGEPTLDERIRRYRTRKLKINSEPAMPVLADGTSLGNTPVTITVKRRALNVITGLPTQPHVRWGFIRNLPLFRFLGSKSN